MIQPDILPILRCPVSGQSLTFADPDLVAEINAGIAGNRVRDRLDQKVNQQIEGGLIPTEGGWLYPIREGIPTLIGDNAIRIETPSQK